MFLDRLRYELKLMGRRVILTPILVMLGFALIALFLHSRAVDPARTLSASLEMIIPLVAGIVVATITSQDMANAPKRLAKRLIRRYGPARYYRAGLRDQFRVENPALIWYRGPARAPTPRQA